MKGVWYRTTVLMVMTGYVITGCASDRERSPSALVKLAANEKRCGPPSVVRFPMSPKPTEQESAGIPQPRDQRSESSGFSPQALEIADTIGARNLIAQIPKLETENAQHLDGAATRLLRARQQVSDRIVLAFLDVARTAAEADCEEERADQLADRLQEVRDEKVRYRTLVAIVGDALVGIMAGAFGLAMQEVASEASAIFGGSLATVFGFAAAFAGEEHELRHPRNLLKEIWEGPQQSQLMPGSVWRFLNRPLIGDPKARSFRETLIMQWREDGRLGTTGSETEQRRTELFFGNGGIYEIEDLRARASMLDLLEAEVNLMSEHLQLLMNEVIMHDLQDG